MQARVALEATVVVGRCVAHGRRHESTAVAPSGVALADADGRRLGVLGFAAAE
jgi:hypothetical protein